MATKLFLRGNITGGNRSGVSGRLDMDVNPGAGLTTAVTNTTASGTEIRLTKTAAGTALEWTTLPLGSAFLLQTSEVITFNIWAIESNMNNNCGGRARLFVDTGDSALTEVAGGPYNDGVEFGTTVGVFNWTGSPSSNIQLRVGDRFVVRFYLTNVGTMGGGGTCTVDYDGPTGAADGDSYIQFASNLTFKSNEPFADAGILRRHTKPAHDNALVQPGHPLAPSHAWLFNNNICKGARVKDYGVSGRHASIGNTVGVPDPLPAPGGMLIQGANTSIACGSSALFIKGARWSAVWAMKCWQTPAFMLGCILVGSSKDCYVRATGSPTTPTSVTMELGFGDQVVNATTQDVSTDAIWCVTAGGRGLEIWKNGVKVGSSATVPTFVSDASLNFFINSGNGAGGSGMWLGFIYLYQRQLSPSEVKMITASPFGR